MAQRSPIRSTIGPSSTLRITQREHADVGEDVPDGLLRQAERRRRYSDSTDVMAEKAIIPMP